MIEKREKIFLSCFLLLSFLPFIVTNEYNLHILIIIFHNILLASSLNLVMSLGLLSVAQSAFMAIGAYSSALLVMKLGISFWLSLPISMLFSGLTGLIIGFLTLNIRGIYFVITTLAFTGIVRLILINWKSLLGGLTGIIGIPYPNSINFLNLFSINFNTRVSHYYLMLVILALSLMFIIRLNRYKTGRAFQAVRETEELAQSVGINVFWYKILAFVLSSIFAGLSGCLYAHYVKYINPEVFSFWQSFNYVVFVILGGQGTLLGPIIGAIILTLIPEVLRVAEGLYMLFYSVVLILAITFVPQGIVPYLESIIMKARLFSKN